ncbi:MAG: CocE/NonD family hydrolase, partial [Chitinophagaceae bacterium]|nr:CocE/NonD family hydrolase [Chitinophagaceae bacterium]
MKKPIIASLLLFCFVFSHAQPNTVADSVYLIQDSVLIPTKSGIPVSAIIVRKKTNTKPLPALLFYTTYYQGPTDANAGKRSADRDYVGIVAYARGIRTNLKHYAPYEHEATDVYDIIDWISKQQWCNGKVGMFSGSYTGFSQWSTAKNVHPALKTIVPQVAVMPGFDTPLENNVELNLGLYWPNDNIYKHAPLPRGLPFEWFENGTAWKSMDSLAGNSNAIFQKWLQHPSYDQYWQRMVPTPAEYAKINIPVLTTTGYYDGSQISALQYYKLHTRYNRNANHYVVIGPYDHWGGQRRPALNLMGYNIDSVANVSMMELAYEWLDYILKNKPKPALLKNRINYQVMGSNEWKHAASLQQMNNDTLTFYLHKQLLVKQKQTTAAYTLQTVDFKDRETENNFFVPQLILDSLDAGNGLIFSTAVFEKEFAINGSFTGNLFATINKKDMDVSLALFEQMPDGKYFYLTRYLGR